MLKQIALLFGLLLSNVSQADVVTYLDFNSFTNAVDTVLVEDFQSIEPVGTPLPKVTSNGITYTGLAGVPFPNVYIAGYFGSRMMVANGQEDIHMEFSRPTHAVGFETLLNGLGPATVQVFGGSGLLDTIQLDSSSFSKGYLGMVASESITELRWTATLGATIDTGFDNLRQSVVPEPSGLAMLVVGSTALLTRRRNRGLIHWKHKPTL